MKLSIELTPTSTILNGVKCRVWNGVSESGVPCKVFVRAVAVDEDRDNSEFDAVMGTMLVQVEATPLHEIARADLRFEEVAAELAALKKLLATCRIHADLKAQTVCMGGLLIGPYREELK